MAALFPMQTGDYFIEEPFAPELMNLRMLFWRLQYRIAIRSFPMHAMAQQLNLKGTNNAFYI